MYDQDDVNNYLAIKQEVKSLHTSFLDNFDLKDPKSALSANKVDEALLGILLRNSGSLELYSFLMIFECLQSLTCLDVSSQVYINCVKHNLVDLKASKVTADGDDVRDHLERKKSIGTRRLIEILKRGTPIFNKWVTDGAVKEGLCITFSHSSEAEAYLNFLYSLNIVDSPEFWRLQDTEISCRLTDFGKSLYLYSASIEEYKPYEDNYTIPPSETMDINITNNNFNNNGDNNSNSL